MSEADRKPAAEWQPIETAPKDGRDIILHCAMSTDDGEAKNSTMVGHFEQGRFVVMQGIYVGKFGQVSFVYMPWTHWMPLPDLPEAIQ